MTQGLVARAIYSVSQSVLESEAPKAENVKRGLRWKMELQGREGPPTSTGEATDGYGETGKGSG